MDVRLFGPDELRWPLGHEAQPHYDIGGGQYNQTVYVDPYPAHAPDEQMVKELVAECEEAFPLLGADGQVALLGHEPTMRFNGMTWGGHSYRDADKHKLRNARTGEEIEMGGKPDHTIALSAKRVPIMPAMLRYLVAHEYGHAAWNHAVYAMGLGDKSHQLQREYIETRARGDKGELAKIADKYVARSWHASPCEIIANDFRVVVMRRETEFWPHEVAHPNTSSETCYLVEKWWSDAKAQIAKTHAFVMAQRAPAQNTCAMSGDAR